MFELLPKLVDCKRYNKEQNKIILFKKIVKLGEGGYDVSRGTIKDGKHLISNLVQDVF